jgi:hypothetical protein
VFDRGKVTRRISNGAKGNQNINRNDRCDYATGIFLWAIWKTRYEPIFQGVGELLAETVKELWSELLPTLKGQWERVTCMLIESMRCVNRNIHASHRLHGIWIGANMGKPLF